MSIYFDPSMGALNRFLASDETGNVAGPELLDRLAGYPAKVDELWQQERMLREMIASSSTPLSFNPQTDSSSCPLPRRRKTCRAFELRCPVR